MNIHLPTYQPEKDKFLSHYFERQTRIRTLSSSENHNQKTLKTESSTNVVQVKMGESSQR
jgi:hypothetical protein